MEAPIYFTSYSVGAALPLVLSALLATFLLRLRERTPAALHLGLATLFLACVEAAYVVAGSLDHPAVAVHRLVAAGAALFALAHAVQFFLHYPRSLPAPLRQAIYAGMAAPALLSLAALGWMAADAPIEYRFDAGLYDFAFPPGGPGERAGQAVIVLLLLETLALAWAGAYRLSRARRREERATLAGVLGAFALLALAPVALLALTRFDLLESRGLYQASYSALHCLGLFALSLAYLRGAREPTTLFSKLAAVALTVAFLLLQIFAFFVMQQREASYARLLEVRAAAAALAFQRGESEEVARGGVELEWSSAGPAGRDGGLTFLLGEDGVRHAAIVVPISDSQNLQVLFPYREYRAFLHSSAALLMIVAPLMAVLLLLTLPFVVRGAILRPVEDLVAAARELEAGRPGARAPVRLRDEIGFLAGVFNTMARAVEESRRELRAYAGALEDRVAERTAELEQRLEEIRRLKLEQDGDYFLTSMLIQPLGQNAARQTSVRVEFLVEQKKKFQFRQWKKEIGGDLCLSRSVRLGGRDCTFFLNADALGKSMLGAGGALVLGAVCEAIVERAALAERRGSARADAAHQLPERWLKNAFLELHRVFESFDGYMLVSVFMGLVDDASGLLLYLNADHPEPVLFRDGRAEFVRSRRIYRKLGTPGVEAGKVYLETRRLQPGDVWIAGTDGRDDLALDYDPESGEPRTNEDPELFRECVAAAGARLPELRAELLRRGALTDDLGLLRLEYAPPIDSAPAPARDPLELRRRLAAALAEGSVEQALELSETAGESAPEDLELLELRLRVLADSGLLEEALQLGESLRLRAPERAEGLQLYADLLRQAGEFGRAEKILEDIRAWRDPPAGLEGPGSDRDPAD